MLKSKGGENNMRLLKNKVGFSLVEMVIAIGLLGAVAIGTGTYMSNSFKDSNKLSNKADVQNSVTALMNKLGTEIKQADIPVLSSGWSNERFTIRNSNGDITFTKEGNTVKTTDGNIYEYIEDLTLEEKVNDRNVIIGANIKIKGQDGIYELESKYYSRNTVQTGGSNPGPILIYCKCCNESTNNADGYCNNCKVECSKCAEGCRCGKCKAHCQCTGYEIYCKCCGDEIISGDYCSTCKKACECGCSGERCKVHCGCNKKVKLTYDAKEGYLKTVHRSAETYNITCPNKSVTATVTTAIPTREGYKFIGWGESSTTSEVYMQAKETLNLTGNKTIYAYWEEEEKKVNVFYDPNGGSIDGVSASWREEETYGDVYEPSESVGRVGYTFAGWYTEKDGDEKVTIINRLDDHTVYAHWVGDNITVELDPNGGTVSPKSISVTVGSTYGELPVPTSPASTRYKFDGWYTREKGGKGIKIEEDTTVTTTPKLYAHWKATLTFDENGGKNRPEPITVYSDNNTVTIPNVAPEREYYDFAGWGYNRTGDIAFSSLGGYKDKLLADDTLIIYGDQTIYAQWEPSRYTLQFNANGGKNAPDDMVITMEGEYYDGEYYDEVDLDVCSLTREGYKFLYWSTDPSNYSWKGTHYNQDNQDKYVEPESLIEHADSDNNITLYAQWEEATEEEDATESSTSTSKSETKEYTLSFKNVDGTPHKITVHYSGGAGSYYQFGSSGNFSIGPIMYSLYYKLNGTDEWFFLSGDGSTAFISLALNTKENTLLLAAPIVRTVPLDECMEGNEIVIWCKTWDEYHSGS